MTDTNRQAGGATTEEHLRDLISRWQRERDPSARDEVVGLCLPLARRLAARYRNPHEPFDDLVQVASLGLLGAIDRFDVDRETSFRAFAIPTILGEIKRHFRQTGWSSHVPRGAQELSIRLQRAIEKLCADGRREPTTTELAEYLEIDLEDVLVGLEARAARYAVSYDASVIGDDEDRAAQALDSQLGDDDDRFGLIEMKLSVATALDRLPHRERQAVRLRMSGNLKQSEIAEQMNCSQMQISRLLRRAAHHVREDMNPAGR